MNSATAMQRSEESAQIMTRPFLRPLLLVVAMIGLPILAGLWWHHASDDPLWPVFRSSLNLCDLHQAQLSPVSPDGRYRVHVVQATCVARFPETMVFVAEADEAFPLQGLDPNRAVLEVAGHRTLDAVTWIAADDSSTGKMQLQLWTLKGSMPNQLHRLETHWRDVPVQLNQSQPAAGAEKFDY